MTRLYSCKRLGALLALCLLFLAVPTLRADTVSTWSWGYDGNGYSGSGSLQVDSPTSDPGELLITGITGFWTITTTDTVFTVSGPIGSSDNLLISSNPLDKQLDSSGVTFLATSLDGLTNVDWNISYVNGDFYIANDGNGSVDQNGLFHATPPVSPVPEPSSIVLLGTALMALAGLVWFRKQNQEAVTAA